MKDFPFTPSWSVLLYSYRPGKIYIYIIAIFFGKKSTIFDFKIEEFFSQQPEISLGIFCAVVEIKKMDKKSFENVWRTFKAVKMYNVNINCFQ